MTNGDATVLGGASAGVQARRMKGRRPKADDSRRICSHEGCDTVLSRYNRGDTCFAHRRARFPRIRAPRAR